MYLLRLAIKSAWYRRYTLSLIGLSIALSAFLLVSVERARTSARESFSQTISQTDLLVGPRTGGISLLLYSVFHIGDPTNNIDWKSYTDLASDPNVAWTIPISLGDSHRGFPVLATNTDYFAFFHYGDHEALKFSAGGPFGGIFGAVVGSSVAKELGYRVGDEIVLSHGMSGLNLMSHADKPFKVVGILTPTGTPVDRTVDISLAAMEAIHLDWQGGAPMRGVNIQPEYVTKFNLTPRTITAMLIGLKSRAAVFAAQRKINEYRGEPLMAILPGVALDQLWQAMGAVETTLFLISVLVVVAGVAGLVAVLLAGLDQRRRELAILRSVGAAPAQIFGLVLGESLLVSVMACVTSTLVLTVVTQIGAPRLQAHYGLTIETGFIYPRELALLAFVVVAALLAGLIPAFRAYRQTLGDGLTPRT